MSAVFSVSASIYGRHEVEQSSKQCDFVVCLSLELQQIECAVTYDAKECKVWTHSNRSRSNSVRSHTSNVVQHLVMTKW